MVHIIAKLKWSYRKPRQSTGGSFFKLCITDMSPANNPLLFKFAQHRPQLGTTKMGTKTLPCGHFRVAAVELRSHLNSSVAALLIETKVALPKAPTISTEAASEISFWLRIYRRFGVELCLQICSFDGRVVCDE